MATSRNQTLVHGMEKFPCDATLMKKRCYGESESYPAEIHDFSPPPCPARPANDHSDAQNKIGRNS